MKIRLKNTRGIGRYRNDETGKEVNIKKGNCLNRGYSYYFYLYRGNRVFIPEAEYFNFIKYPSIEDGFECVVKIRYKDRGSHARLYNTEDGLIKVEFLKEVKAPTLGQSAVAVDYEGDVIGGGHIHSVVE